jgi:pimeloyl-ACP methyl ester carboxylesterase
VTAVPAGWPAPGYEIEGAEHRMVELEDIVLSTYVAGPEAGRPLVLAHGFPELAYSWRHQIPALAAAGYRVIAPDQRGYGQSTRPGTVEEYDVLHLTADLAALAEQLGKGPAVYIGHDWGGVLVWRIALLRPDDVAGVASLNTPYAPRTDTRPMEVFRQRGGEEHYIRFFQRVGVAERELDADVDAVFRRTMRGGVPVEELEAASGDAGNFYRAIMMGPGLGRELLDEEERAVFVGAFEATGFAPPLSWYRNEERNWELMDGLNGARIDVPCLMVTAEWDSVLTPARAAHMKDYIDDLETKTIAACGHWTQQEHPAETTAILLDWLGRRFPAAGGLIDP